MATASEEELRDLLMELYLKHGERTFEYSLIIHRGLLKMGYITDKWMNRLTPKALKLIRGETK